MNNQIPKDKAVDSTIALLRDGYRFIQKRRKRYNSDIFQTRLMGEKAICISGEEAAKIFYDPKLFRRKDAIPKRVQKTLMGKHGVQTLDGKSHRLRKDLFMAFMTDENIRRLIRIQSELWREYALKWEKTDRVTLFPEVQELLCRAVCAWCGAPLSANEARKRARDLGWRVDAFGKAGYKFWRGIAARRRSEKWMMGIIEGVRNGRIFPDKNSPLYAFASHGDEDGNLLPVKVAAVDLLNIIRPTVAVATYIVFTAVALHERPEYKEKLYENESLAGWFVQEVRRFYPFTPFLGARVRQNFEWQGGRFKEGDLVLLDVYGALHDHQMWDKPEEFRPERFKNWKESAYDFIPQGGGDYAGHRCAGEWVTIETLKLALSFLARRIDYDLPEQDLSYDLSDMPTLPRSGFVIENVRMRNEKKVEP